MKDIKCKGLVFFKKSGNKQEEKPIKCYVWLGWVYPAVFQKSLSWVSTRIKSRSILCFFVVSIFNDLMRSWEAVFLTRKHFLFVLFSLLHILLFFSSFSYLFSPLRDVSFHKRILFPYIYTFISFFFFLSCPLRGKANIAAFVLLYES